MFACDPGKSPATPNGFYDANTDPAKIRGMFTGDDLLIGMPTGAVGGVDVVDVDPRNVGRLSSLRVVPEM